MNIAYIRVSSLEQNTGRQLEAMRQYQIERFFEEKISGRDANRPHLKAMMEFAREGDIIYIESISRLARNTLDFLNIVEQLNSKKVSLISLKEKILTPLRHKESLCYLFLLLSLSLNAIQLGNVNEKVSI